jgi:hypothetical protein
MLLVISELPPGMTVQDDWEQSLAAVAGWNGRANVYASQPQWLKLSPWPDVAHYGKLVSDLEGWRRYWRTAEAGSLEGTLRFQGGNLVANVNSRPLDVTPDDFRLRADSAGYQAGPDGKNLGADVDRVGPGEAYQRWKQTPAYSEWRQTMARPRTDGAHAAAVDTSASAAADANEPQNKRDGT